VNNRPTILEKAAFDDDIRTAGIVNSAGDVISRNADSVQTWQKIARQLAR